MPTHSNILAWRIPWIDEPREAQSIEVHSHKESDMTEVTEQSFKIFPQSHFSLFLL